jgi:hypothetical protein
MKTPLSASLSSAALLFFLPGPAATRLQGEAPPAPTFSLDDPGSWAFTPAKDEFSREALFDLRGLNEPAAGQRGFVTVNPEGDFLFGDGTPARFWAVNFEPRGVFTDEDFAYAARFLAKRGVNMVRWHGFLNPKVPGSNAFHQPPVGPDEPLTAEIPPLDELDRDQRELSWRIVAAMRREGIYLTLSPYWAVNFKHAHRFGLPAGVQTDRDAQGLLFFEPRMQAAYKQWLRDWLLAPNPYTGIPLARDPAVAVIQFQNEDSLLFGSADFMSPEAKHLLTQRFGEWLAARHGSLKATRTAWGPDSVDPSDDWDNNLPALLPLGNYRSAPAPERARRLADQLEFYTRTMHDANAGIARYLREELGVRSVLNANNWRTVNGPRLNDAERWSYLPAEALAVNRYYNAPHVGRDTGWTVQTGHRYANVSALQRPQAIPVTLRQVEGRAMLVSESTWVLPNLYRAEAPITIAAYLSLTGIDAYYWFAFHGMGWSQPVLSDGRYRGAFKWTSQTPDVFGQFPATALLFRRGDVKRGAPALRETRLLSDLWAGKPPALVENPGFDPNRDTAEQASGPKTSALTYLVGPVQVDYTSDPAAAGAIVPDSKPWVDSPAGIVRANTGEIELDHQRGLLRLDTPRAQGAAGFFPHDSPPTATADALFDVRTPYAQVLAVSLDDRPLATSGRVLLQIGTTTRPTGWQTRPAPLRDRRGGQESPGEEIVSLGGAPWRIENASGSFRLRNPILTRATVCDANGMPVRDLAVTRDADGLTVALPSDAIYVVLR